MVRARSVHLVSAALAAAVAGCGGHSGHGGGSRTPAARGSSGGSTKPAASSPSSGGISKEGLAAIEIVTAVAESAAMRAAFKECYAICAPPTRCDRSTGFCTREGYKTSPGSSFDPLADEPASRPPAPGPTCGGLCMPGERCVVVNGAQDCVALDKLPPR